MTVDPSTEAIDDTKGTGHDHAQANIEALLGELADLAGDARSSEAREEIRETKELLAEAHQQGLIDSGVRQLRASDAAEAFVGSVIFASPLLIEDGVFDIADYLFGFAVAGVPVFLIANTLFVVLMTYALLEWTGRNTEEAQLLFGVVPLRVIMILVVSFLVSAVLMTVWGRVGDWQPATEAIARINVIWTVGSMGAALGDILSDDDVSPTVTAADEGSQRSTGQWLRDESSPDSALVGAIHEQFDELEAAVDDGEDRHEVRRLRARAIQPALGDAFGDRVQKYTGRDIAEAFVGGVFFSIPFLVEDGVFDVADYFLSFRIGYFPVFFLVNTAFVVLMIAALVYWAGPQDVRVSRPILGVLPRRLVGISLVSFLTAGMLMTMWGRVGNWQDPVVAVARISVVWTVASFGAALGDILPGESSGDDINDDLAEFGEAITRIGEDENER